MSKLYNPDVKESFLETLPENQIAPYRNTLFNTSGTEESLKKDLFDFTSENIQSILYDIDSKSLSGVRTVLSYIKNYIGWAIGEGYRNANITPIDNLDRSPKALMEYVDKNRKTLYSEEEIKEYIKTLLNYQEKVILQLAFYEGITMEELIELNYNNVGWRTGILKIRNKEGIKISDESLRMIESAYHESEMVSTNEKKRELIRSDFVLRNVHSARTKNVQNTTKAIVFGRISNIREKFELDHFTYKALIKSGMIYEGYKMFDTRKTLGYPELNDIADKFGIKRYENNGYLTHNVTVLSSYINRESILELYGVDIEEK